MAGDRINLLYSMLIRVRDGLRERGDRLVLAESCTAGLVAAQLGQIPGISNFLCGSMVIYRTSTKTAWLGISSEVLQNPATGPVSATVTLLLAGAILTKTPEATLAAAITGHLGPGAPKGMDGQVYCAVVRRGFRSEISEVQSFKLSSGPVTDQDDFANRHARQKEAAYALLSLIESRSKNPAD
ncbi:MAG TPA: CinA family protein [Pirellula sp.]|nr:CinA family protein [Pirellula sp.]